MRKRNLYSIALLMLMSFALAGCGSGGGADNMDRSATVTEQSVAEPETPSYEALSGGEAGSAADSGAVKQDDLKVGGQQAGGGTRGNGESGTAGETGSPFASGFAAGDLAAGLNKKLIYRANLNMEVENYEKAQTEVRNMINLAQGYIIGFTEAVSDSEQGGTFVLKVPASGFSSFLDNLDKIKHESLQRNIQGQDVSEEYVDLEARLKAKQLLETQYVEFMKQATKATDLVSFANELGKVQEEIEQIKGRMRYIDQNVMYSTVELRLYQPDGSALSLRKEEGRSLLGRASDALRGTLDALFTAFQWLLVFLAGALPILLILAVVLAVLFVLRRSRRRGGQASQPIGESNPQSGNSQSLLRSPASESIDGENKKPEPGHGPREGENGEAEPEERPRDGK